MAATLEEEIKRKRAEEDLFSGSSDARPMIFGQYSGYLRARSGSA